MFCRAKACVLSHYDDDSGWVWWAALNTASYIHFMSVPTPHDCNEQKKTKRKYSGKNASAMNAENDFRFVFSNNTQISIFTHTQFFCRFLVDMFAWVLYLCRRSPYS